MIRNAPIKSIYPVTLLFCSSQFNRYIRPNMEPMISPTTIPRIANRIVMAPIETSYAIKINKIMAIIEKILSRVFIFDSIC